MSQQPPPNDSRDDRPSYRGAAERPLDPPGIDPVPTEGKGPGSASVGVIGIVALTAYLVVFAVFLLYCLIVVWPVPTPAGVPKAETASATATPGPSPSPAGTPNRPATPAGQTPSSPSPTPTATPTPTTLGEVAKQTPTPSASPNATPIPEPKTVNFLSWQIKIWDEQRLLLLVLLAGALGSLVHDIRSVYWYIGNRSLVKSWLVMYLLLPFAGATLAMIFYLVVRGGFFSPQSGFDHTSPFGFTAMAALVGMFSPQAALKLREVSETLLSKPQPGANPKPQGSIPPPPPPPVGGKVS